MSDHPSSISIIPKTWDRLNGSDRNQIAAFFRYLFDDETTVTTSPPSRDLRATLTLSGKGEEFTTEFPEPPFQPFKFIQKVAREWASVQAEGAFAERVSDDE